MFDRSSEEFSDHYIRRRVDGLAKCSENVETCACTLRHESDWRMYRANGHRPLGGACIVVCLCIFISAKARARGGLAK